MPPKRKQSTKENDASSSSSPAKKKSKSTPQRASKAATRTVTQPAAQAFTPSGAQIARPNTATSYLIPVNPRRKAVVGQRDDALLRILCTNTKKNATQEQRFQKIPFSRIDWNSAEHIRQINDWRNQIYTRAGMKAKEVNMWLPDEELWIELYYQLSIAEARKHGLTLPKAKTVGEAFMEFFAEHQLTDRHGQVVTRTPRAQSAFGSKFNRVFHTLRERLVQSVVGQSGDEFIPNITEAMMDEFRNKKEELIQEGGDKVSGDSQEWRDFFANLASENDTDGEVTVEEVERPNDSGIGVKPAQEASDAAATLTQMASQSDRTQTSAGDGGNDNTKGDKTTPLVSSSPPSSSSITHANPALSTPKSEFENTSDVSRSSPLLPSSGSLRTQGSGPQIVSTDERTPQKTRASSI
ncbi:hypothetical protein N0V94_001348 [Neodidymelliopsis sp. IMI 364377]|nr:hypothetical protein N0V94_001348 [Neodidymelliopsis sp. IMI 364377]